MKLLLFLLHYGLAISSLFIPENWMIPYTIAIVAYLFIYYGKIEKTDVFRDVHPFFVGYGSFVFKELVSVGMVASISVAILILVYISLLYKEKRNEENKRFHSNQIGNSVVYAVIIPFSVYLGVLYLWEMKEMAFMFYYTSLFYGLYKSRFLFQFNMYAGFLLLNVSLLMLYSYQYAGLKLIEEIIYVCIVIAAVMYHRIRNQRKVMGGS